MILLSELFIHPTLYVWVYRSFSGHYFEYPYFGQGDGNVMVEGLQCAGYETDIKQCKSKTWLSNTCDHSKDVSIDCHGKKKKDTWMQLTKRIVPT